MCKYTPFPQVCLLPDTGTAFPDVPICEIPCSPPTSGPLQILVYYPGFFSPFLFWRCPASLVLALTLISGLLICHMGNIGQALIKKDDVSPKPLTLTPDVWALPSKLPGERRNWPRVLYYLAWPWLFLFSQEREPFLTTVLASTRAYGHGPLDHKFCKERIHIGLVRNIHSTWHIVVLSTRLLNE